MLAASFSQFDPERRFAERDGHVNERRRAVIRMSINLRDFVVSSSSRTWTKVGILFRETTEFPRN
jgi:hypothetical protein